MVKESRQPFNLGTPRSFIRGVIHYPGVAFKIGKRKECFTNHFSAQEKEKFSPAATRLVEKTVNGIFLSLENEIFRAENARDVFSGKDKQKDHLEDVFDRYSFFFTDRTFSKQLVQFELLYKGGKHW